MPRTTAREWVAVLAGCSSPLLLLFGSRDWFLTPIFNIDPWTYVGFFHHYTEPNFLPGHYKLARLPWILAGWLVSRFAPGVAGAYVLHAIFLVAGGCGFYVLLRALFGRFEIALLGAMLLVFHPSFHGSGGWDYHNTAAGPVYLWALAAVTLAALRGGGHRALLAGIAAALAVHCNITYGVFLPVLAAHYLFVYCSAAGRFPSWRALAGTATWGMIGAVGVTGVLSAINVLAGREALFFGLLLNITLRYTAAPATYLVNWWQPWSAGWFWMERHLALPTAVLACSPVLLHVAVNSRTVSGLRERLVAAEFLVMAAVWTAWQFAGNLTVQWNYFFYPLQPHVLLALMAVANRRLKIIPSWILIATPFCLVLLLSSDVGARLAAAAPPMMVRPLIPALACFLLAAAALWMPRGLRVLAFVVVFSVGNGLVATEGYSPRSACHDRAASYSAVVAANQFMDETDPGLRRTRLWFDESQRTTTKAGCTVTVAQIGYSLAGAGASYLVNPFPMPPLSALPDAVLRDVSRAKFNAVIVSSSTDSVTAFERRALQSDAEADPLASRWFDINGARFEVSFLRMQPSREPIRRAARWPGAVIGDWTRETLTPLLSVNTYAVPRREVIQRGAGGERTFVPATATDHVVTPFLPVPPASDSRVLLVAAAPDAARNVNCTLFVQDQRLRTLASVNCGDVSAAMQDELIPLSTEVTSIRVFFQGHENDTIVLPGRLRISYHHGDTSP